MSKVSKQDAPRVKFLSACVGFALLQMAGAALADSGFGADNLIGNADNPGYNAGPVQRDVEAEVAKRTPSGQLYEIPPLRGEVPPADGSVHGQVEAGLQWSGDRKRYSKRNEYSDPQDSGLVINNFSVTSENAKDAFYFNLNGGAVGRDDQFYTLNFGKYNDWKLKGFYNETPHVFSDTFKNYMVQSSAPGGVLQRPSPIFTGAAGATFTAAGAYAQRNNVEDSEVGLIRKKGGLRGDLNLTENWKAWGIANREVREGGRPFTATEGVIEGIEPIDYVTDELAAGLSYVDKLTSFNLRASASFFKNSIDSLYTTTALWATAGNANMGLNANLAQWVLPPDNESYNIKAELKHKLPSFYNSVVSASYAWGSNRQDDPLATPRSAWIDGLNGVLAANANWNGVNGTPGTRATSGLRLDSQLLNLSLVMRPIDALSVKGAVRHYETNNKSGFYHSYNPLTGEWYRANDGGLGNIQPTVVNVALAAIANNTRTLGAAPRDNKQTNYTLSIDYDIDETSSIEGLLERENFSHTFREREKTWENKWKLGYVNRALAETTLRVSYEQDRKRGSSYDPIGGVTRGIGAWFTVQNMLNGSVYSRDALISLLLNPASPNLVGVITGNNQIHSGALGMMRVDQADRDQNILNARVNYQAMDNLDIGGMVQLKRMSYPTNTKLGWERDDLNTYNFDFNYQASAELQVSGYYSRQDGKQRHHENYVAPSVAAGSNAANLCNGGAIINTNALLAANLDCILSNMRDPANSVPVDTKTTTDVLGLNLSKQFGDMLFTAGYTYTSGKISYRHGYIVGAGTTAAQAASEYPEVWNKSNALDLGLAIPISKTMSARLMYRYEDFKSDDWHYYPNSVVGLGDLGPANFKVNTLGAFLNFKM